MELTGLGFVMKSIGSVFLGLKSLTSSLSFTIQKLEEIWTVRQLTDVPTHTPKRSAPTGTQQPDSFHPPPVSVPRLLDWFLCPLYRAHLQRDCLPASING